MQIINPTQSQINKAEEILRLSEESCCITGHRYAMTPAKAFVDAGNISLPKSVITAIRYLTLYASTIATCQYVLYNSVADKDLDMYPVMSITAAKLIPVATSEIPSLFDEVKTIINISDGSLHLIN